MRTTQSLRLLAGAILVSIFSLHASAAITFHPATPYLQSGDADSLFDSSWPIHVEDFEDNAIDPALTLSGEILPPFFSTGSTNLTDSVDGDDGTVDGNGNGGYSFFNDGRSIMVTFASPVTTAGLVWTDGDPASAGVTLEAFGEDGMSLGFQDYMDLGDDMFTGETAEDRFIGASDLGGIKSLVVTNLPNGNGIEIDHIHWQACSEPVPEPASIAMFVMGLAALASLRRRK